MEVGNRDNDTDLLTIVLQKLRDYRCSFLSYMCLKYYDRKFDFRTFLG